MKDQAATVARLDEALIRLRRFWSRPTTAPIDRTSWPGVELSTVLVADALARTTHEGPDGEVTVADVAARLDVAHSTASRLVDRAVQVGAVERHPSRHDARRTALALTDFGRRMVAEALGHRRQVLEGVLAGWSPQDVATLALMLTRLADAVQSHPPHPTEGEER